MPTDDERREVAQRLRESRESALGYRGQLEGVGINLFCFDQADYYLIYKSVYGLLPAGHMDTCDYAEFHDRLADLIEPEPERTCHIELDHDDPDVDKPWHRCRNCGYTRSIDDWSEWSYCPCCGARVIDGVLG